MPRSAAAGPDATAEAAREAALERGTLGPLRVVATEAGAALLRSLGEGLLADPPRVAGAALVKENALRSVWRIPSAGAYLKSFRPRGLRAFAARLLRGSPARREWSRARALLEAGIETGEPLGFLESRRGFRAATGFFLCREVPGARTATSRFAAGEGDRPASLRSLAAFLAQFHAAGFDARDLHGGDLLLGRNGWSIVDLHAVSGPGPVSQERRARSLALVLRGLRDVLRAGEAEALLAAYEEAAGVGSRDAFRALVDRSGARLERTWRRSRARRCLEGRGEFARERAPGRRIFRRRDLSAAEIERALAAHAAAEGSRLLDRTPRGSTSVFGSPGGPWLVKETRAGGLARALADLFRGSRGRRAWRGAHLLGLLRLPTPRALALVEERRGPLVLRSFVVREFLAEASTLRAFLAGPYAGLPFADRRAFLREVGGALAALHRAGLHHRDLATKNLLVRRIGGRHEVSLIDLEDLRARAVGPAQRVAALAQLGDVPALVSRADRLRALRAYEEAAGARVPRGQIAAAVAGARARAARRERAR